MKFKIFTFIVSALFATQIAQATENGGRGGGNSASDQVLEIKKMFKQDNGESVKTELLAISRVFETFEAQGSVSAELKALIQRGLNDDIKAYTVVQNQVIPGTYNLSSTPCLDDHGKERSASTDKVDLSAHPGLLRPSICINVLKLAEDNATRDQIIGTMLHEHARHFGVDDTINDIENPIISMISHADNYSRFIKIGNLIALSPSVRRLNGSTAIIHPFPASIQIISVRSQAIWMKVRPFESGVINGFTQQRTATNYGDRQTTLNGLCTAVYQVVTCGLRARVYNPSPGYIRQNFTYEIPRSDLVDNPVFMSVPETGLFHKSKPIQAMATLMIDEQTFELPLNIPKAPVYLALQRQDLDLRDLE